MATGLSSSFSTARNSQVCPISRVLREKWCFSLGKMHTASIPVEAWRFSATIKPAKSPASAAVARHAEPEHCPWFSYRNYAAPV